MDAILETYHKKLSGFCVGQNMKLLIHMELNILPSGMGEAYVSKRHMGGFTSVLVCKRR